VLDVGAILGRFADGGALTAEQRRAVADLSRCRTQALGGRLEQCSACGRQEYRYNSCRNRHCPRCQGGRRAAWLGREAGHLLPVEYHHVVFTLPAALAELARRRPRLVYGLLLSASAAAVLELAADPKYLGARVGLVSMLHTWGQTLTLHPHAHVLATGGGLSCDRRGGVDERPCWRSCRPGFFLPVRVLGRLFRGKFLAGLRAALGRGPSAGAADAGPLSSWLRSLYGQEWVVYSQPPAAGAEVVLKYLARYVHRVAISNSRLREVTDGGVTFAYKDYRRKGREKEMTLPGEEFARRFAQHVLPRGFVRVRHYGLLANRGREAKLAVCRRLLRVAPVGGVEAVPVASGPRRCAACGEGRMVPVSLLPRAQPVGVGCCRGEDSS
jgi:Putative transposase/Transposase zinc-binding domain